MRGFILVTFGFLGAAFYQLSGGADFEPRGKRSDNVATLKPYSAEEKSVSSVQDLTRKAAVIAPRKETEQTATALTDLAQARPAVGDGMELMNGTQPVAGLQLASLEQGVATGSDTQSAEQVAQAKPKNDIRKVKGNRVNLRQGPGTNYPIIARLNGGYKVEILSDPGNGWLRLRTSEDKRIGWISATLVTKAK